LNEPAERPASQTDKQKNRDDAPATNPEMNPMGETPPMAPQPAPLDMNRRRFLNRAVGGAAALTLAACGRGKQTPSPMPGPTATQVSESSLLPSGASHQVFMPVVKNGQPAQAALVPTLTPEPTLTPTPPKATDTPAPPTPTPTPVATPFPPGPPGKLGLFVARNHPQLFDLLKTQGVSVVKTLELDGNFAKQIKETSRHTLLIGRIDLPQLNLATFDPLGEARRFVDELVPVAEDPRRQPYFDGWEAYNEPVAANGDEMARLAEFEAERTRLLAERGLRSVVGNFGAGQPPLDLWERFLPAVQAVQQYNGWLGLHEYSAPTMYYLTTRENQGRYPGVSPQDTGWLTLRYRQVYDQILKPAGLAVPLIFTELGIDGLVTERPGPPDARGWKDFQSYWAENGYGLWGPGAYIEQLVWYDEAMRQDSYVDGGCIYALAASAGWESYDILGPAAAVLEQYLSVHAPV
jgi:hypothetical protein